MPVESSAVVLIADDNPVNRELAVCFLQVLGYEALTAEDGFDALEKFQRSEPVAVLMDVNMPRMDGLEATRRLRAWERAKGRPRVPVITWTATEPITTEQDWRAAGGDAFLPKPLDLFQLRSVLGDLVPLPQRADAISGKPFA